MAIDEKDALDMLFKPIKHAVKRNDAPGQFWWVTILLLILLS